jgi:hypothetical protein
MRQTPEVRAPSPGTHHPSVEYPTFMGSLRPMARTLGAFALLTSALAFAEPNVSACEDTRGSCRETCTLEFGTDPELRNKLGICFERCDSGYDACAKRIEQAASGSTAPRKDSPVKKVPPASAPARPAQDPVPELVMGSPAPPSSTTPAPAPRPPPVPPAAKPNPPAAAVTPPTPKPKAPAEVGTPAPPPGSKPAQEKKNADEWEPGVIER